MGARREREIVYRSSTEGGYGIGASTDHVDASHADRIDISDAELLFRGHFARSGPDLVLTGQDGHRLVVTGYFATEKLATWSRRTARILPATWSTSWPARRRPDNMRRRKRP